MVSKIRLIGLLKSISLYFIVAWIFWILSVSILANFPGKNPNGEINQCKSYISDDDLKNSVFTIGINDRGEYKDRCELSKLLKKLFIIDMPHKM